MFSAKSIHAFFLIKQPSSKRPPMRISIIQTDIHWEAPKQNLLSLENKLQELAGKTDLVVLPETFSTGFSMQTEQTAEPMDGETMSTLRHFAATFQTALCGSFVAKDGGRYFNRAFFVHPHGETVHYDKRHLFRMGEENKHFAAGRERCIVPYMGWNICLMVCYDLRFPVWSRNVGNEYDLLIYVANWPHARQHVWETLLSARAIENVCFVCGANRIGKDNNGLAHHGGSQLISPKGKIIAHAGNEAQILTATIDRSEIETLRTKFPTWKDADAFSLHETEE